MRGIEIVEEGRSNVMQRDDNAQQSKCMCFGRCITYFCCEGDCCSFPVALLAIGAALGLGYLINISAADSFRAGDIKTGMGASLTNILPLMFLVLGLGILGKKCTDSVAFARIPEEQEDVSLSEDSSVSVPVGPEVPQGEEV